MKILFFVAAATLALAVDAQGYPSPHIPRNFRVNKNETYLWNGKTSERRFQWWTYRQSADLNLMFEEQGEYDLNNHLQPFLNGRWVLNATSQNITGTSIIGCVYNHFLQPFPTPDQVTARFLEGYSTYQGVVTAPWD